MDDALVWLRSALCLMRVCKALLAEEPQISRSRHTRLRV